MSSSTLRACKSWTLSHSIYHLLICLGKTDVRHKKKKLYPLQGSELSISVGSVANDDMQYCNTCITRCILYYYNTTNKIIMDSFLEAKETICVTQSERASIRHQTMSRNLSSSSPVVSLQLNLQRHNRGQLSPVMSNHGLFNNSVTLLHSSASKLTPLPTPVMKSRIPSKSTGLFWEYWPSRVARCNVEYNRASRVQRATLNGCQILPTAIATVYIEIMIRTMQLS